LFAVADGTTVAQIEGMVPATGSCSEWSVYGGVNRRRPAAAGKSGHVKRAVLGEVAGTAGALEVVQADGGGFEEVSDGTRGFQCGVRSAERGIGGVGGPTPDWNMASWWSVQSPGRWCGMNTPDPITFRKGLDGALQAVANVAR